MNDSLTAPRNKSAHTLFFVKMKRSVRAELTFLPHRRRRRAVHDALRRNILHPGTALLLHAAGRLRPRLPGRGSLAPSTAARRAEIDVPEERGDLELAERHEPLELAAHLPARAGGGRVARSSHGAEPADELADDGGDVGAAGGQGPAAQVELVEAELEHEDGDGLHQVVHDAPPGAVGVEPDRVGGVGQEVGDAPRGHDALARALLVDVLGAARLVGDAHVDAAEAGAVEQHLRAVEAEAEDDPLARERALVAEEFVRELEGAREGAVPLVDVLAQRDDFGLGALPGLGDGGGGVEVGEDLLRHDGQVDAAAEVVDGTGCDL